MSARTKHPRLYVWDLPTSAQCVSGVHLSLPATETHHALHVLRLKAGAKVELFNGRGRAAVARVTKAKRAKLNVVVERSLEQVTRPEPEIHLGFAMPKGKRLDWLLEKATELGAASLHPVVFERSVAGRAKMTAAKRERWLSHCVSAAKQCGLDFLPKIHLPANLRTFLRTRSVAPAGAPIRLIGSPDADAPPLTEALTVRRVDQEICLLIGPEGGLTEQELSDAAAGGFVPARLGHTTLRTETAAVALLAATVAICEPHSRTPR